MQYKDFERPFCLCGCGEKVGNDENSHWRTSKSLFKPGHNSRFGIPWTAKEKEESKKLIYKIIYIDKKKAIFVDVEKSRRIIERKKKKLNYKYEDRYLKTKRENGKRKSITTPIEEIIAAHSALLFNKDSNKCWCCQSSVYLEKCHIRAESDGGSLHPDNLILLCESCHNLQHFWAYSPEWNKEKLYDWFKWMDECPKSVKSSTFSIWTNKMFNTL